MPLSARVGASNRMMNPIIFLDIDGVLVPDVEDIHHHPQFHPRCVAALKSILRPFRRPELCFAQLHNTRDRLTHSKTVSPCGTY